MTAIKSISAIAKKWADVTPNRAAEYAAGVKAPRRDWATNTLAAEGRQAQGVQTAISEGRFGKGVRKAGNEKWTRKTLEKGTARWGQGVRLAQNDYETGFRPYRDAIEALSLPERGPKGDPGNINRVAIIAQTLHNVKRSMGA
jgi:hypothetical protein